MKKKLMLLIILGISLNVLNAQEKVNFKNIKIETIDGKVYEMYNNKKFSGIVIKEKKDTIDSHLSYIMEYEVKEGMMNGKAITTYSDGFVQKENFVNNILDGQIEIYYPNGKIKSKTSVVKGIYTGPFEDYYENGNLKQKGNRINNEFDGEIIRYNENGKILDKTNYSLGKVEGLEKEYNLNKKLNSKDKIGTGTMIDSRDNQTYKTFTFIDYEGNSRTWMAQNLNYQTSSSVSNETNKKLRKKYPDMENAGMAYNWNNAMEACPKGWHLPSDLDWQVLIQYLGGRTASVNALKSTQYWHKGGNGTNSSGFNALPTGGYYHNGKNDGTMGKMVHFWSSLSTGPYNAIAYQLRWNYDEIIRFAFYKAPLSPCRCIKDYPE